MKKVALILGLLTVIAATPTLTQQLEGVITYETTMNMHRALPDDRKEMRSMIPEYRTTLDQLLFNAAESLYLPVEEEPEPIDNGKAIRMHMRRPKNQIYTHPAKLKTVVLHEFMGKKYLVEDSLKMRPWKLAAETRDIHGYTCRKATMFDEERKINVVAWYSDRFRPFLGPENFNTLPGAVLLVDINDGERIITAKNIELRPLKKNEMRIPDAKTKTTEEEYRKMVREQMDRMRANGGNVIIRD